MGAQLTDDGVQQRIEPIRAACDTIQCDRSTLLHGGHLNSNTDMNNRLILLLPCCQRTKPISLLHLPFCHQGDTKWHGDHRATSTILSLLLNIGVRDHAGMNGMASIWHAITMTSGISEEQFNDLIRILMSYDIYPQLITNRGDPISLVENLFTHRQPRWMMVQLLHMGVDPLCIDYEPTPSSNGSSYSGRPIPNDDEPDEDGSTSQNNGIAKEEEIEWRGRISVGTMLDCQDARWFQATVMDIHIIEKDDRLRLSNGGDKLLVNYVGKPLFLPSIIVPSFFLGYFSFWNEQDGAQSMVSIFLVHQCD
jgi:hypothetical protein